MLNISGYLSLNSDIDIVDDEHPLTVTSCGHYTLVNKELFKTDRAYGRRDFQLLYVKKGIAYFDINGQSHAVTEGHIVIYHPNDPQSYYYKLCDAPDIYWIHFTGYQAKELLKRKGLSSAKIINVMLKNEYSILFDNIIHEFQLRRKNFEDLANTYAYELFNLMSRSVSEIAENNRFEKSEQIEQAVKLLQSRFYEPFSLSGFAKQCNMSVCWFTRIFHRRVGVSPQQYLTDVRMNKAKELLASTSYNIGEIGEIVGYQNALYFSRIFKKQTGYSPSEYKKQCLKKD
jgi:AraC-like DNA-binding protein